MMHRTPARNLVAVVVLLGGVSLPMRAQQPTFSSRVEAVRIDALVTAHGKPVRGLTAADFEVFDNGVRQVADLAVADERINVVLALDASSSVSGQRLEDLRTAGRTLLGGLREGDRAALVTFSHLVLLGSDLTPDRARVQAAVEQLEGGGDTALIDGAYAALVVGDEDVGRSLLVVFSDGSDTRSWLTADAVVGAARRSNVVAYAVATGGVASPFLKDLTEATGGRTFDLASTKGLGKTFLDILDEFRGRYAISFSPKGVARGDGWHRLEVRVKNRRATVKARAGYFAPK